MEEKIRAILDKIKVTFKEVGTYEMPMWRITNEDEIVKELMALYKNLK